MHLRHFAVCAALSLLAVQGALGSTFAPQRLRTHAASVHATVGIYHAHDAHRRRIRFVYERGGIRDFSLRGVFTLTSPIYPHEGRFSYSGGGIHVSGHWTTAHHVTGSLTFSGETVHWSGDLYHAP